jgi:hypothetical protein
MWRRSCSTATVERWGNTPGHEEMSDGRADSVLGRVRRSDLWTRMGLRVSHLPARTATMVRRARLSPVRGKGAFMEDVHVRVLKAQIEYWRQRAEASELRLAGLNLRDVMIWCACGDGFQTIQKMHDHIHMVHDGFEDPDG